MLSAQVPVDYFPKSWLTVIWLNEHHSVLIINGGNSLTNLLHNSHSLASSNSGELNTHRISTINLSIMISIVSIYGVHIERSHRRSQHFDLDVLVIDVGNRGLLHSKVSYVSNIHITSRQSQGFRTSGK